jgi:hypothetical protein
MCSQTFSVIGSAGAGVDAFQQKSLELLVEALHIRPSTCVDLPLGSGV